MTNTIVFNSDLGEILLEATDASTEDSNLGNVVVTSLSTDGQDFLIKVSKSFEEAMQPAINYAGALRKMLGNMDQVPTEITLEIGLALKGSAGFFSITSVEAAADIKLSLTWSPVASVR